MAPQELRDVLTASPFEPFRIILSDGTISYDVADPFHVLVTNRSVHLGITAHPGDAIPDRIVRLDLLHVTQLVPLRGQPKPPQGNGQTAE